MSNREINNINASDTIVLECNNKDSIKVKSLGLGSRKLSATDNAVWTNNFNSIPIKKGDELTMEYAIINQIGGGQADTMEFNININAEERKYNDNSVIFEIEFYLNHNGINSLGMPYCDYIGSSQGTINTVNDISYGEYKLDQFTSYVEATGLYDGGTYPFNINRMRCRNRLQLVDCGRYTKMTNFSPYHDTGIAPDTYKKYIQFEINDAFLTPDTLANKLNLRFHNTDNNDQGFNGINPSQTLNDNTIPMYFKDVGDFTNVFPFRLNKDISIICPANGIILDQPSDFTQPTKRTAKTSEVFFVKNPDRWIGGTYLNYTTTNNLLGDTDLFPPTPPATPAPQLFPRIITRYRNKLLNIPKNLLPQNVNTSAVYKTYQPIFTTIDYTSDNIIKIKKFLHQSKKYYGDLLDETKALKEPENWTTWADLGRSNDAAPDIGVPLHPFGTLDDPNETCPTIDGQNTGEDGAGISCVGFIPDYLNNFDNIRQDDILADTGTTWTTDLERVKYLSALDVPAQLRAAQDENVGAYPYEYTLGDGGTFVGTYFLVSRQMETKANEKKMRVVSTKNYIGFSPSAFDNHYIIAINPEIDFIEDVPNGNSENNVNYINVGAFDVNFQYDIALSRFGIFNLHTDRKFGVYDDYASASTDNNLDGQVVAKIGEKLAWDGTANTEELNANTQAKFGRYIDYLDTGLINLPAAPLAPNPVPYTTLNLRGGVWTGHDALGAKIEQNRSVSDAVCGVFISEVYFGTTYFNADEYTSIELSSDPRILDRIAVKSTADNWYGSLLWKMGGNYEDFHPQFTAGCRQLRFNDIYYRNKTKVKNVAPLTTNQQLDTSVIQNLQLASDGGVSMIELLLAEGTGGPPPTINTALAGVPNYQLGFSGTNSSLLVGLNSAAMFFTGSIHRAETGFYRVYTNFASPQYLSADGGDLNVIGLALKSYNSADFYYSYSPSYSMTADRDFVLTTITTELRDSNGNIANVGDRCVVVYKITKGKEIPILTKKPTESPEEEILNKIETTLTGGDDAEAKGTRGAVGTGGVGSASRGETLEFGGVNGAISTTRPTEERERVQSLLGAMRDEDGRTFRSMDTNAPIDPADLTTGGDYTEFINNLFRASIETALNRTPLPVDRDGDIKSGGFIDRLLGRVIVNSNERLLGLINQLRLGQSTLNRDMTAGQLRFMATQFAEQINGIEVNRQGRVLFGVPLGAREDEDLNAQRYRLQISNDALRSLQDNLERGFVLGRGELQDNIIQDVGRELGRGGIQIIDPRSGDNIVVQSGRASPTLPTKSVARLPRRIRGLVKKGTAQDKEDPAEFFEDEINRLLSNPPTANADEKTVENYERELRDLRLGLIFLANEGVNVSRLFDRREQAFPPFDIREEQPSPPTRPRTDSTTQGGAATKEESKEDDTKTAPPPDPNVKNGADRQKQ